MPKSKLVEKAERIASKSRLTRKDAKELAVLANRGVALSWKLATRMKKLSPFERRLLRQARQDLAAGKAVRLSDL